MLILSALFSYMLRALLSLLFSLFILLLILFLISDYFVFFSFFIISVFHLCFSIQLSVFFLIVFIFFFPLTVRFLVIQVSLCTFFNQQCFVLFSLVLVSTLLLLIFVSKYLVSDGSFVFPSRLKYSHQYLSLFFSHGFVCLI